MFLVYLVIGALQMFSDDDDDDDDDDEVWSGCVVILTIFH